jgi:hypothetical protein
MNDLIAVTLWGNSSQFVSITESGSDKPQDVIKLRVCVDTGLVKTTLSGIIKSVDFATVRITQSEDNLTSGSFYISKEDEVVDHLEDRRLLDYRPYIELAIKLTPTQFSELLKLKGLDPEIEISAKLEVTSTPINIEGDWGIGGHLREIELNSKVGGEDNKWIGSCLERAFHSQMSDSYIDKYSQIKNIASEFASSARRNKKPLDSSIKEELLKAKELLSESRSSFKPAGSIPGYEYDSNNLSAIQFLNYVNKIADKKVADNLKKDFDNLWQHYGISAIINHGEKQYGHAKDGFDPKSDDIINLGRGLLSLKQIHSEYFERLIVDSLIYIEVLGFARHVHTKKGAFGMSIDGELRGAQESSGSFAAIPKIIGQSLWFYAKEFIKIAITFGVATLLTQENGTAAWVITVGYTGYRWVANERNTKTGDEYRKYELLMKMSLLHNYFASNTINDRFILKELYRIEAEGARFDPVIFDIMERRVMRKNQL